MNYVTFSHPDGRIFRVNSESENMNCAIEQRFMIGERYDREIWNVVYGPNNQLRALAIKALA